MIDFETFARERKEWDVVPFVRELIADGLTPVAAFRQLSEGEGDAFLLESVERGEQLGRYSFLGANPRRVMEISGSDPGGSERIRRELVPLKVYAREKLPPFAGGAVGLLGWSIARWSENLPDRHADSMETTDAILLFFNELVVFDHVTQRVLVISNCFTSDSPDDQQLYDEHESRLAQTIAILRESEADLLTVPDDPDTPAFESNVTREEFEIAVEKARDAIVNGEAFQIVLSQRWTTDYPCEGALTLYRALRSINPSPYMFIVRTTHGTIVGSSPETLVSLENGRAETHPIAGTRRRGATPEQDRELEEELLADPKEMAEHLMLVDLGRNDLGKVCTTGSVEVHYFSQVERYSHVMHIVSRVRGALRKGLTAIDLLLSVFPAGTLSGAPKIRAMELIDELENDRRNFYGGAVAYFDFAGNLDSCIAIRTIWLENDRAHIQAGAGIVFDSVPSREFEETIEKSQSARAAIALARSILRRAETGE